MKRFYPKIVFIFIFLFSAPVFGQVFNESELKIIDSLESVINDPIEHDIAKIKSYIAISEYLYRENIDTVVYLSNKAIELVEKGMKIEQEEKQLARYNTYLAQAYNNIGFVVSYHGEIQLSLDYYHKSINIQEEILTKFEDVVELESLSDVYNNLGFVYSNQKDSVNAFLFYTKSLEIDEILNDQKSLSTSYNNIGTLYLEMDDIETSLEYLFKGLAIREELQDDLNIANSLNNIGSAYKKIDDVVTAKDYYTKSLAIYQRINNLDGIAHELGNLALINIENGNFRTAKTQALRCLKLSQQNGYPPNIEKSAFLLSQIYEKENNGIAALKMYKLHITMRDSLNKQEIIEAHINQQAQYEYEKKKVADSTKQAEEYHFQIAIEKTKLKELQDKRKILYIGLCVLVFLLIFIFLRYRVSQKQKTLIEKQKQLVEVQHGQLEKVHKEVSDSIKYAQHLQKAILPAIDQIDLVLQNTFVLFKPKDNVSGDFYWLYSKNDTTYFAVADCTGHGVPGAMVSVVCGDSLNRSVKEFDLESPAAILDKTRELVIETFSRSGQDVKDGMDIALCKKEGNILTFAGANNPLWIIRDISYLLQEQLNDKKTVQYRNRALIEFKGDKQPIGVFDNMTEFNETKIELKPNDVIFLFSDGYADQFGGVKGKKLKYKPFKQLLLENVHLEPNEFKTKLEEIIVNWSLGYEQVDDICIMGVGV